jgi:hypothetical protein
MPLQLKGLGLFAHSKSGRDEDRLHPVGQILSLLCGKVWARITDFLPPALHFGLYTSENMEVSLLIDPASAAASMALAVLL